jgi:hypothetical protein
MAPEAKNQWELSEEFGPESDSQWLCQRPLLCEPPSPRHMVFGQARKCCAIRNNLGETKVIRGDSARKIGFIW